MRQRRLPILMLIFIGILTLVVFRLYCNGTHQGKNRHKKDQQEAPSKRNTVFVDKKGSAGSSLKTQYGLRRQKGIRKKALVIQPTRKPVAID